MQIMRRLLLFALLATPPAAATPPRALAVVRVGSAIDEAAIVGRRRAGTLCLPDGKISWSEVAGGAQLDQREAVQDALEDAGVPLVPLGEVAQALRLRALIRDTHFDLCARHWGLGDGRALSGQSALTVEWRVEDGAAPPLVHVSAVSMTTAAGAGAPLGAIYRSLLARAARDAAAWLLASPR